MAKKTLAPLNIARTLHRAAQALQSADPETAESLGREVLARAPGNLQGLWLLGRLCLESGRHQEAADHSRRALDTDPRNVGFHLLLAEAQRRLGATTDAADTLRALIRIDATNTDALCNLSGLLTEAGACDEAEKVLRQALAVSPGHPRLLGNLGTVLDRTGRIADAIAAYSQALDAGGGIRETKTNLANSLVRNGQPEQAVPLYRSALAQFPDDTDAWHSLGTVLHRMGIPLESADCFRRVLELEPDRLDAHLDLAALLYDMGRAEEALPLLAKAAELAPADPEIMIRTGTMLASLERFAEASKPAEAAAAMPGPPSAADYRLASLFVTLGNAERARAHLDRYLEADPGDALGAHLLLAELGERNLPDRAPDNWLRSHYAHVATRWDQAGRNYPPELVAAAVRAALAGAHVESALDAGCGTGIVGVLLADVADCIDGVDISPEMIVRARAKGVYRELVVSDLTEYLASRPAAYDVITAAATLIHMADLRPSLVQASHALRTGGLLVFTLLRSDQAPVTVARFNGQAMDACFAHSREHIQEVAPAAGFDVMAVEDVIHELDRFQRPIPGLLVSLRKRAASSNCPAGE